MPDTLQFVISQKNRPLLRLFAAEAAKMLPRAKPFPAAIAAKLATNLVGGFKGARMSVARTKKKAEFIQFMREFLKNANVKEIKTSIPGTRAYEVQRMSVSRAELDILKPAVQSLTCWKQPEVMAFNLKDSFGNTASFPEDLGRSDLGRPITTTLCRVVTL